MAIVELKFEHELIITRTNNLFYNVGLHPLTREQCVDMIFRDFEAQLRRESSAWFEYDTKGEQNGSGEQQHTKETFLENSRKEEVACKQ